MVSETVDPSDVKQACVIPVNVEALVIRPGDDENPRKILSPLADFSKLPNTDNPGPFVSRAVVETEFQSPRFKTQTGVHLHWMLPEAIRRTHKWGDNSGQFPAAPNRWIVERLKAGTREKAWVVESDYLSKTALDDAHATIPLLEDAKQPFRYLGRALPIDQWTSDEGQSSYWRTDDGKSLLTAVGYGDPAFAAYYPNCKNVFGFVDPDADVLDALENISYRVFGWYSDPSDDILIRHQIALQNEGATDHKERLTQDLRLALPDTVDIVRMSTLCYGKIEFAPDGSSSDRTINMVGLGNTGSEALAACLANDMTRDLGLSDRMHAEKVMQAIMLDADLRDIKLDIGAKFEQARHASSFDAVDAGIIWSIDAVSEQGEVHAHDPEGARPTDFAPSLAELQELQIEFNAAEAKITSLRRQMFSDWYEFQRAQYHEDNSDETIYSSDPGEEVFESDPGGFEDDEPYESGPGGRGGQIDFADPDNIKARIRRSQTELEELTRQQGTLRFTPDETGKFVAAVSANDTTSLAAKIASTAAAVLVQINANNTRAIIAEFADEKLKHRPTSYGLNKISAPRYWRPKNPVLVLGGPGANTTPSTFKNLAGLTDCRVVPCGDGLEALLLDDRQKLVKSGDALGHSNTWCHQPWHPIMMEWGVEVFPTQRDVNFNEATINKHYGLDPDAVELSPEFTDGILAEAASNDKGQIDRHYYTGTCVLTRHPHVMLKEQFGGYLKTAIENDYQAYLSSQEATSDISFTELQKRLLKAAGTTYDPKKGTLDSQVTENTEALVAAYAFHSDVPEIERIKAAYAQLSSENFNILSQSLGGFNQAMLQHRQVLQLPVMDPNLGDTEFVEQTDKFVGDHGSDAPNSVSAFLPIRTGTLAVDKVRIIDRFGQSVPVDMSDPETQELITPAHLDRGGHKEHHVWMPPRIHQDTRLHFRWLDAISPNYQHESNDASSPICGWIIPNFLDETLAVHATDGTVLGAITAADHTGATACWRGPPGANNAFLPEQIANPHLKRLVEATIATILDDPSYLDALIKTCGSALENMNPDGFDQHKSTALLCGRPIGVTRASLNLELKGAPAIDRNVGAFKHDVDPENTDAQRTTLGFEEVKFPLRLGEYKQLNDGLIGYWVETTNDDGEITFQDQKLYAPQSTAPSSAFIEARHDRSAAHLDMTLQDDPHYVTMLVDPRGEIHATTGILPTKALTIPMPQYSDALEAIEVTFEIYPVLSDVAKLHLPLGEETTASWTWLAQSKDGSWPEISRKADANPRIHPALEEAHFGTKQKLRDGWLKLTPTPKDKEPTQ